MSWTYLPESVAAPSPQNTSSAGAPSATSKTPPTPPRSSKLASATASSMTPPSGTTRAHSTGDPGVDAWISSLLASRASHSAPQASDSLALIHATSGQTPAALLTKYDPLTSSWKTSQGSLPLFDVKENGLTQPTLGVYSQTWPRAGTMLDGIVYQLQPLVPPTREIVSGLLPTPVKSDSERASKTYPRGNPTLLGAAALWPTPTTPGGGRVVPDDAQWRGKTTAYTQDGRKIQVGLDTAVRRWPTPTVTGNHNKKGASPTSGDGLATAVKQFPTPTARDCKAPGKAGYNAPNRQGGPSLPQAIAVQTGGKLNPNWVEWLMGWPIGWTDLQPLATDKFQQWLQSFGNY